MEVEEVLEVVRKLNDEINENLEEASATFYFGMDTDGYSSVVTFMGINIWSSEDDERDFVDNINEYEPLIDYLKFEANKMIENLIEHQKVIKRIK